MDELANQPRGAVPASAQPAAAVRAIRSAFAAATADAAAACGFDVAGRAYEAMRTAWLAELDVQLTILERANGR